MKAFVSTSAIALMLLAFAGSNVFGQEEIRWAPDIESAKRASAQFKVPLLVHFYGDNCLPCRTLEERVYTKPELIQTLNKYFICVKVNATQNPNIASEYAVHSWPSDVFLSPDGEALYQGVCQQDLSGYLSTLQSVAVRNRDRNLMLAAQQQTQATSQQVAQNANLSTHSMYAANAVGGTAASAKVAQQAGHQLQQAGHQLQQAGSSMQGDVKAAAQQASQATMDQLATAQQMLASQMNATQNAVQNTIQTTQTSVAQKTAQANAQMQESLQTQVQGLAASADAFRPRNRADGLNMPPLPGVTKGPLAQNAQPKSITGTVSQTATQVVGNAVPVSNNVNGQLPPPASIGQTRGTVSPTVGRGSVPMESFVGMPTMSTNTTSNSKDPSSKSVTPTFTTASTAVNVKDSQKVSNPFYNPNGSTSSVASKNQFAPAAQAPAESLIVDSSASTADVEAMVPAKRQISVPAQLASTQLNLTSAFAETSEDAKSGEASTINLGETMSTDTSHASNERKSSRSVVDVLAETADSVVKQSADAPALEGYCPVALAAESKWVEGDAKFAVKHRGKIYWMSSQDAMDKFLAAPDASAPVLSGYDPLILLEEGRLVEGSIQFGLHEQISGTYLLFTSAEGKQKYWNDFDRYSKALKALLLKASQE